MVALMHRRYGHSEHGGHPHWLERIPNVDLAQPVPFQIDMCSGNAEMWSEENCEFNLIVVLDGNGNNTFETLNVAPDPGEPAALKVVELSCRGTSPCLDVPLDCVDGVGCVAYEPPGDCVCAPESCNSDSAICQL